MTEDFLVRFTNIDTQPFEQYINKCKIEEIDITDRSTKGNSKQVNFVDSKEITKLGHMFLPYVEEIEDKLLEKKLVTSSAWIVEGNTGSYHRLHNHTISKPDAKYKDGLACVLYLDVPDDDDRGEFYFLLRKKNNRLIMDGFHPNKGDLIMMPKTVFHGVYPQKSKGVRKTLNFDYAYEFQK